MTEVLKHHQMHANGFDAAEVYAECRKDGLILTDAIRAIRSMYGLPLIEAENISCEVDGGEQLQERQGRMAKAVVEALDEAGFKPST